VASEQSRETDGVRAIVLVGDGEREIVGVRDGEFEIVGEREREIVWDACRDLLGGGV
jgi:hypothetical protein